MIGSLNTLFNGWHTPVFSGHVDGQNTSNAADDNDLVIAKLMEMGSGKSSRGTEIMRPNVRFAESASTAICEESGKSIFDDPVHDLLLAGATIAGGVAVYHLILYFRDKLELKKLEALKANFFPTPPDLDKKLFTVTGMEASTATVKRETWKPEKLIANLMMREDRELGSKKEELERAVTAAITEWFDLPLEQREELLKTEPDALTFSKHVDGTREETILYPWIKKRALKIHAENPITTPPRGAEAETTDVAVRETITFIKDFFNPQDAKDTALMTNSVSLAIDAVAEGTAREKPGLLAILGEMAEFYGELELAKKAYEALVRHEVLSKDEETKGRLLKSFSGASAPARFLLLGELARTKDHFSAEEFKDIIDTIISSETRFSSLRDIADDITNNKGTDAILQNAQREAGLRFSDTQDWSRKKWENSGLVAARLKDWRERIENIESRIEAAREARRGKRR